MTVPRSRWAQQHYPDPPSTGSSPPNPDLSLTDIWIDGSNVSGNASDSNPGTSAAAPLKTWLGGLIPKWEDPDPLLTPTGGMLTIHIMSDMALGDEMVFTGTLLDAVMEIDAVLTPLAPGVGPTSIGVLTARNQTAALPGGLLTPTYNAPAPPGMLIENTTAGKSSRALVFADTGAGNQAQMYQPHTIPPTPLPFGVVGTEVNTWAGGDTVVGYTLPKVVYGSIRPGGGATNAATTNATVTMRNLHVIDPSGVLGNSTFGPDSEEVAINVIDCWIEPFVFSNASVFLGSVLLGGGTLLGEQSLFYGGSKGPATLVTVAGNFVEIGGDAYFDGTPFVRGNCSFGAVGWNAANTFEIRGGRVELVADQTTGGNALLWGHGTLDPEAGGVLVLTGGTWATVVPHVTLLLDSSGTGTSYTPGTGLWASGILLTPANLDADGGLQNPISGAKYVTGQ